MNFVVFVFCVPSVYLSTYFYSMGFVFNFSRIEYVLVVHMRDICQINQMKCLLLFKPAVNRICRPIVLDAELRWFH